MILQLNREEQASLIFLSSLSLHILLKWDLYFKSPVFKGRRDSANRNQANRQEMPSLHKEG